ncbi:MAG: glycerol-3-phosphate dehydrogenase/oxidase [Thermoguttaceae bacterium]|nr:glycerol-3-phosphate dehydrogenase/oxidase [Thermoguttaceae bacterium]
MRCPWRPSQLAVLEDGEFDVLVIGGGIVGAGVLYAAARQGLRAVLIDQSDFAFGTSSRSSRLLHGGLRYLAQGRVRLVFEASQEKLRLARVIPHLVQPLPFVFPSYRGSSWPLWQLWVGVKIYDALCFGRNFGASRTIWHPELDQVAPGLRPRGLRGAVRYFDALTNDARLVVDTLRGACKRGAIALNYVRLQSAQRIGSLWQCEVVDEIFHHIWWPKARCIVNATGPWGSNFPQSQLLLRLTKGIHLVVDRAKLPVNEAIVLAEGRRILFAIPWGERVILGTTDTDYSGYLEEIPINNEDVDYILRVVNEYFPASPLTQSDIRAAWAGVRPLLWSDSGGPSDISRAHVIYVNEEGWVDIAGGKLTTYLRMGEQAVAQVLKLLGRPARPVDPGEPILDPSEARVGVLPPEPSDTLVEQICREEWVCHLDDIMIRRTSWHSYRSDVATLADRISRQMARLFGWSERERQMELDRYRKICSSTFVPWVETAPTEAK